MKPALELRQILPVDLEEHQSGFRPTDGWLRSPGPLPLVGNGVRQVKGKVAGVLSSFLSLISGRSPGTLIHRIKGLSASPHRLLQCLDLERTSTII